VVSSAHLLLPRPQIFATLAPPALIIMERPLSLGLERRIARDAGVRGGGYPSVQTFIERFEVSERTLNSYYIGCDRFCHTILLKFLQPSQKNRMIYGIRMLW
jgi:hypothetical protein